MAQKKELTPEEILAKRESEKKTVRLMIGIYCNKKHGTKGEELCTKCLKLADYCDARVDHCPHMADKTFCSNCETHCYKPDMREQIRQVMRFSGPRMIFYCPKLLISHKIEEIKKTKSVTNKQIL